MHLDAATDQSAMKNDPSISRPEPPSDVLTPKQAATYLRLSHRTLETMRTRGGGPPFAKYGDGRSSRVVYRRSDLDAWIASRVRQSTTEG